MSIIKIRKQVIKGIEYTYVSTDENIEFICDRCLRPKISKKYVEYVAENGKKKRICNGCYGTICSIK